MTANAQLSLVFTGTTAERFEEFHREHAYVYRTLVSLAREWINQTGLPRMGIKTLYEAARWQIQMDRRDGEFKLNNDFTAYYARLIMAREPDLADIFELRSSAADEWVTHYLSTLAVAS